MRLQTLALLTLALSAAAVDGSSKSAKSAKSAKISKSAKIFSKSAKIFSKSAKSSKSSKSPREPCKEGSLFNCCGNDGCFGPGPGPGGRLGSFIGVLIGNENCCPPPAPCFGNCDDFCDQDACGCCDCIYWPAQCSNSVCNCANYGKSGVIACNPCDDDQCDNCENCLYCDPAKFSCNTGEYTCSATSA